MSSCKSGVCNWVANISLCAARCLFWCETVVSLPVCENKEEIKLQPWTTISFHHGLRLCVIAGKCQERMLLESKISQRQPAGREQNVFILPHLKAKCIFMIMANEERALMLFYFNSFTHNKISTYQQPNKFSNIKDHRSKRRRRSLF